MSDHIAVPAGYFDHNATSPIRPRVTKALQSLLGLGGWGNPSSVHQQGRRTSRIIEESRERVASSLKADPRRITFLSGATEANHAGIRALAAQARAQGKMAILANPLEHPSVLGCLGQLQTEGFELIWADLDDHYAVSSDAVGSALLTRSDLGFAVCMAANNETGALQPWDAWVWDASSAGLPVHVDATQLYGKRSLECDLPELGNWVISGHKVGALSGIGVLHSHGVPLEGWLGNGPQERSRRGGTENLFGIFSMGVVAQDLKNEYGREVMPMIAQGLQSIPGVVPTVPSNARLPNTLHVKLPVRADLVVQRLDLEGFAVSSGSACSSGSVEPSPVLLAMGWSPEDARCGLRISTGWTNTPEESVRLVETLSSVLADLT